MLDDASVSAARWVHSKLAVHFARLFVLPSDFCA
jgi:hypothetical protein